MLNTPRLLLVGLLSWYGHASSVELLSAEDLARATELREAALEKNQAWDLLESLTTEVGPRMAGTPGDAAGVAWARAKFEALGFDRVITEPVTFPVWERGTEAAEVVAPFPQPLTITALGGSRATPEGGITAELAHFRSLADLEAASVEAVRGRLVFISNRMERFRDGSGYGPAVQARSQGAIVAAAKGGVGIMIRSIGTDDDRLPHTGLMRLDQPTVPAAALSNPDADLLERMLRRADSVTVRMELGSRWGGEYTSHNVIGDILGREAPDEFVVIGGHLDSWDLGTGAIDDGAGCAITMAAAHLIGQMDTRPRRTIRVILWANEEQGLYGARAYHQAHLTELEKHIIGSESDFGAGRIYRFSSRVKPEALGVIDQISQVLAPLGIVRGDNNAFGGPDLSPMRMSGMALASLYQDGTDYFDYHHTANDTLDKVEPEALSQNVAAYAVFAYLSAEYRGDFGFRLGLEPEQLMGPQTQRE
ncbi:MAG: M20/M25/M40 family metallo-hydrolase [Xanthomonadales bacterium]|nr:M20/M25/M40 family metallo-hydrolase [Xanthomonadales bacterium]